jgi:hypothetical protein
MLPTPRQSVKRCLPGRSYSHYGYTTCGRDGARPSKLPENGCFQSWRDDLRVVRCAYVTIMRIAGAGEESIDLSRLEGYIYPHI